MLLCVLQSQVYIHGFYEDVNDGVCFSVCPSDGTVWIIEFPFSLQETEDGSSTTRVCTTSQHKLLCFDLLRTNV
jgi:hypothetical protein